MHDLAPAPLEGFEDGSAWAVRDDWVFLNAGSFGMRLRAVTAARAALLETYEQQPVDFLERHAEQAISDARDEIGSFIGADPAGLACVTNATEAIDAVLASQRDVPGDILIGSEAYGAVQQAAHWEATAHSHRHVRVVDTPLPAAKSSDIVDAWDVALRQDTPALAIVDHITSPTGVVQPVEGIIACCQAHGVPVLVDGAHAPGMLPLDIDGLGADWYAGNLHKWVGAPTGAGFLWTAPAHRAYTRPVIASHFIHDGYREAFDWQGTRDITPWLMAPVAIAEVKARSGWPALRRWQEAMVAWCGPRLAEALGTVLAAPPDAPHGALVAARLPASTMDAYDGHFAFRDAVAARHRVEIAMSEVAGAWWVRFSMGPWITPADIEVAIAAVADCALQPS